LQGQPPQGPGQIYPRLDPNLPSPFRNSLF
jgi:hypothetical protein